MKIAVLAANGRSGYEFVLAAIHAGHTIRAGIHGQNPFPENLDIELIDCDATKPEEITELIKGCNAVASFVGHAKQSSPDVQTSAMRALTQSMHKQNIKRIVSLTGTGVRFPGDRITLWDKLLNFSISKMDPDRVADGIAHAKVLQHSSLDWTIIRVLKLTNSKAKPFTLTLNGPTKPFTSRKEVALAALEVIEENTFIKAAPIISY